MMLAEIQIDLYGDIRKGTKALGLINERLFNLLNRKRLNIHLHPGASIINIKQGRAMPTNDINSVRIRTIWRVTAS